MPAYNAEQTLEITYKEIPPGFIDEVILVDDASSDQTTELARKLGIYTIRHQESWLWRQSENLLQRSVEASCRCCDNAAPRLSIYAETISGYGFFGCNRSV